MLLNGFCALNLTARLKKIVGRVRDEIMLVQLWTSESIWSGGDLKLLDRFVLPARCLFDLEENPICAKNVSLDYGGLVKKNKYGAAIGQLNFTKSLIAEAVT